MAFDSHRAKSPSVIVGTRPVGLRARYSTSLVPPNSPPASWRRKGIPSSSQHQSTFCTLKEFFLPQISSTAYLPLRRLAAAQVVRVVYRESGCVTHTPSTGSWGPRHLPPVVGASRRGPSVKIASPMDRETPRKFATPPGTRDVLPPESTRLLDVQARILERFRMHGFREVITPALEYSEVVEEPKLRDASFKLFDPDNQMLLLRPEMTTPIARLVAQRLQNSPPPHKLSYSLPVYRRVGVGRGQSAEFRQAGVEVVGSASPGEDAGALALLFDVLKHLGLNSSEDFSVVL